MRKNKKLRSSQNLRECNVTLLFPPRPRSLSPQLISTARCEDGPAQRRWMRLSDRLSSILVQCWGSRNSPGERHPMIGPRIIKGNKTCWEHTRHPLHVDESSLVFHLVSAGLSGRRSRGGGGAALTLRYRLLLTLVGWFPSGVVDSL